MPLRHQVSSQHATRHQFSSQHIIKTSRHQVMKWAGQHVIKTSRTNSTCHQDIKYQVNITSRHKDIKLSSYQGSMSSRHQVSSQHVVETSNIKWHVVQASRHQGLNWSDQQFINTSSDKCTCHQDIQYQGKMSSMYRLPNQHLINISRHQAIKWFSQNVMQTSRTNSTYLQDIK